MSMTRSKPHSTVTALQVMVSQNIRSPAFWKSSQSFRHQLCAIPATAWFQVMLRTNPSDEISADDGEVSLYVEIERPGCG